MVNGAPFIIGIAGGTASGKTTVCKIIMEELGEANISAEKRKVVCIAQDSFYRKLTPAENENALKGSFNFDHPTALDIVMMGNVLDDLVNHRKTKVPIYDFVTNAPKENEFEVIYPADVILVEGILSLYFPEIRNLFQMKIFVDTDSDVRLARRVDRDVEERGRDVETVLNQYLDSVKPAFEEFCLPTKKHADVIIPRGSENRVAIRVLVEHIKDLVAARNCVQNGHDKEAMNGEAAAAGVGGGGGDDVGRPGSRSSITRSYSGLH